MSRIGKLPVHLPAKVTVEVLPGNVVKVKGPLGELSQKVDPAITVTVEGNEVKLTRPTDLPRHRSLHGLYRALIHNMVVGVSEGFTIRQELIGVGYKAQAVANGVKLSLGYSHDIDYVAPKGVKIACPSQTEIEISGIDKREVGAAASEIRAFRSPEPYKGKGVKYVEETILRKEGKKK